MNFLDLFAGIGGFRMGMEQAGHQCVGYVEIDKFARQSYEAIYDTEGEWTRDDITTISDGDFRLLRGKVDIITGGFPCQSFSIAGKRGGFDDARGTLFFHIARAAEQIQPQYLFLENVKGLLNHDQGRTFRTILTTLDELGYDVEWSILNSKYFGVPQNRERTFIIGHLRGGSRREILSFGRTDSQAGPDKSIQQVMKYDSLKRDNPSAYRTYDPQGVAPTLNTMGGGGREPYIKEIGFIDRQGTGKKHQSNTVYHADEISPTASARDYKDPVKILDNQTGKTKEQPTKDNNNESKETEKRIGASRGRYRNTSSDTPTEQRLEINQEGISNTLTSVQKDNYVVESTEGVDNYRIRKLTPKECWRLQGFPDWAFHTAQDSGVSNSQLYKQAGNSVTVPVIYEIAQQF